MSFPSAEADKEAALEPRSGVIDTLRAGRDIAALVELPTIGDPPRAW